MSRKQRFDTIGDGQPRLAVSIGRLVGLRDQRKDWVLQGGDLRYDGRYIPWRSTRPSLPAAINSEASDPRRPSGQFASERLALGRMTY